MDDMDRKEGIGDHSAGGDEAPRGHFYRVIWRWHFYAGLFVVPFMVMLAVTGIIYLFKPQLDAMMYRRLLSVAPQSTPLSAEAQMASARQGYPGANVTVFKPGEAPDRSSQINLTARDGRELAVFVDPYTGRVLGERNEKNHLQYYAIKLHGELLIGTAGDWLVELAASWGLVLLVSGLYLWWPRKGSRVWGVLLPRLDLKNRRVFWRDLHAVPGFYGVLVVGFLLLTGLPWAGFWGKNFAQVWSRYPQYVMDGTPKSSALTGSLNQGGEKLVPWTVEQMPVPQSQAVDADSEQHRQHRGHTEAGASTETDGSHRTIGLDQVIATARQAGAPAGFIIKLPEGHEGVYSISGFPDDPRRQITLHIDQYSGRTLADARWKDYGLIPKAVEMGIMLHEGRFFGLANQLLMLFACLVVILLAVSGTVMWWRRRPAKTLGAPAMPANFPLWKGAAAIIVVMGLAFPMVGISLIIVLLLDYLLLSRLPRFKEMFG